VTATGSPAETGTDRADEALSFGDGGFGGGWFDDVGGGGGGSGDDGDDETWGPRHYGRGVRIVALCVAGALVLATAGTWLTVAVEGSGPAFDATVTAVGVVASGPTARGQTGGAELVTFTESNGWSQAVTPDCSVAVVRNGRIVAAQDLGPGPAVPARTTVTRSVQITVPTLPLPGGQDQGSIACLLTAGGGG
jgi:hypothetical protein